MQNGLRTNAIYNLPLNSPILVQREGNTEQAGHQDRLYNLLTVKGETYTVKLLNGPTLFQSTVIKLYLQLGSTKSNLKIDPKSQEPKIDPKLYLQLESTIGPAQIDKPALLPQDATLQLVLK